MNLTPVLRRAVVALALGALLAGPLAAQNVVLTPMDGKYLPVRKVHDNRPLVEIDGKLVVANEQRYALKKVDEYRPEFIDVRDVEVKTQYLRTMGGAELNHDFIFHANLRTPYYLENVFLALELNSQEAGKSIFLWEVGDLQPGEPKSVAVTVPLSSGLGESDYKLHLFAGGWEVLTTKMPPQFRDRLLAKMVFKRIAGVQDASPQLFTGPPPEYPSALRKSGLTGHVMLALHIQKNGQVYEPKVLSATDPAFGESALEAVRLWRFLPRVKQGRPVESEVNLPVDFAPPGKKA